MNASFWAGKRVLITGGSGFVGRWILRALADTTAQTSVLDLEPPTRGVPHASFHRVSLLNVEAVASLLAKVRPEVVIHLAGQAGVKDCKDDPAAAFEANVVATQNLLEASRRVRAIERDAAFLRAIVATSSNHVYGEQDSGATPESAALAGLGAYAATKACSDILCRAYAHEYGLPVTVARITNSFGGDDPHTTHIVTSAVLSALRGQAPVIKRSGRDTKAFLYIEDTADAILTLAEHTARRPEVHGQAFNVVPAKSVSVAELVREVVTAAGATHLQPRIMEPDASFEHEHLSDRAMREVIGWSPRYSLADGLKKTVEWYRSSPVAV